MKTIETDVAIIGSGGAGLRAALEVHERGSKALIISKSMHRKSHTVMAEGGIAAALGNVDKRDNWRVHADDTLEDGLFIGNRVMIETLAKNARQHILELDNWGAVFDRTDAGLIHQRPFGAHSYPRVCHVGDRTGLEIVQTLADQLRKRGIPYLEEVVVTNMFTTHGKAAGLAAVDMKTGEFIVIKARALIVATGGYARLYLATSNPWESTGDGYALAYNHGVELWDMEMVQFHPTGMIFPESARGLLVTESVRGDGGYLTNKNGERFMEKYDKERMELSARDVVARAIYREVKEGSGTKRGGVYLDISYKPKEYIHKKLPKMVQQFKDFANIDITTEKMEVFPTAHYTMGGIKVDPKTCMTTIPGLFAAGETAVSVHGANRLGGNSLIDILVFGKIAGEHAHEYGKKVKPVDVKKEDIKKEQERITAPFDRKKGPKPHELAARLKKVMETDVHIERSEKGLQNALAEIETIKKESETVKVDGSFTFNHEFNTFIDLGNMLVCAEATARAALERTESRGAQLRKDYPKTDDTWLVNIACYKDGIRMKTKKYPITDAKERWEKQ